MRIDDLNRAQQTEATQRSEQAGERVKNELEPRQSTDRIDLSQLAETVSSPDPRRLEQLRLEVQNGTYKVSAEAIAKSIVDEHLKS